MARPRHYPVPPDELRRQQLTHTQTDVLRLMAAGWRLFQTATRARESCWLAQGGHRTGSSTKTISLRTVTRLVMQGWIEARQAHGPVTDFVLTDKAGVEQHVKAVRACAKA